jgi:predicted  nucleic acid-binding Zn-ribbon protein
MNIIVKCPECGRSVLATPNKGGPVSEVITTDRRTCLGCNKTLEIQIKIVAKIVKPEEAKK